MGQKQAQRRELEHAFTLVGYVVLTLWAIVALFPLYWMIKNSLEPNQLLSIWPPRILPNWERLTLDNYTALLVRFPLPRWFLKRGRQAQCFSGHCRAMPSPSSNSLGARRSSGR
jgi:ABC-type glycerol-3-phosphate transport system permease component